MSVPTDELMSAFHDRELSPAERAAVEQRLAASAEARGELSEIRQVSELIRELPRQSLPPEFASAVLKGIEREMLIPSERLSGVSRSEDPSAVRSRRWTIGAAAVLTSAASLFFLVRVLNDGLETGGAVKSLSMTEFSAHPLDRQESTFRSNATAPVPGGFGGAGAAESLTLPDGNFPAPALSATVVENRLLSLNQDEIRRTPVGGFIDALQTEGEQVSVVRLTVVDRQEGFEQLQVLLAKNHIEPVASSLSDSKDKNSKNSTAADSERFVGRAKRDNSLSAESSQMLAVYVDSDAPQLAAAMQQMFESELVKNLDVEPPIALAQLGDMGEVSTLPNEQRSRGVEANDGVVLKQEVARKMAESKSANRRAEGAKEVAESKKVASAPAAKSQPTDAAGAAELSKENRASFARQYALQFPANALPQSQQQLPLLPQTASRARNTPRNRLAPRQNADSKATDEPLNVQRPLQVLFVVVDQSPSKLGAPAGPAAKPAIPAKNRTEPAKSRSRDGAA